MHLQYSSINFGSSARARTVRLPLEVVCLPQNVFQTCKFDSIHLTGSLLSYLRALFVIALGNFIFPYASALYWYGMLSWLHTQSVIMNIASIVLITTDPSFINGSFVLLSNNVGSSHTTDNNLYSICHRSMYQSSVLCLQPSALGNNIGINKKNNHSEENISGTIIFSPKTAFELPSWDRFQFPCSALAWRPRSRNPQLLFPMCLYFLDGPRLGSSSGFDKGILYFIVRSDIKQMNTEKIIFYRSACSIGQCRYLYVLPHTYWNWTYQWGRSYTQRLWERNKAGRALGAQYRSLLN